MIPATLLYARTVTCVATTRPRFSSHFGLWSQLSPGSRARDFRRIQAQKQAHISTMAQSYKYVCLGGGNSSGYLAKELVAGGLKAGELCIITDEPVVAYERPALSKAYLFPTGAARLPGFHTCVGGGGERQEGAWYADKGITYLTGTRVVSVDVAGKSLTLQSGSVINWEKLVVATGAEPIRLSDFGTPGADLAGIYYLRNVADADALLAAVQTAKAAGNKAVVVGGGYIGLEVAAGLSLQGLEVTMVFPEQFLMARILSNPELAGFYESYYAAKGIKLVKNTLAKEFKGEGGKVSSVLLSDGSTLPADIVVVGAGARPASSLFKGQLDTDKAGGILVNGHFKTSNPDVYAVGDVASFPLLLAPGAPSVRQEHVTHARSSATQAARSLLGSSPEPYVYIPYFYSREFNLSWQFYGQLSSDSSVDIITWGDMSPTAAAMSAAPNGPSPKFGAYWVAGGKVIGAFVEGPTAEESSALKAVAAALPAAPDDLELLKQQGVSWALNVAKL